MCDMTVWGLALLFILVTCHASSPPSLSRKIGSRLVAKIGKTAKLECPADSSDPVLTQWKKNGQALNPGWERFKMSREGHLKIKDVQFTDAGLYTCVATNGYGSMSINYTVIVLDEENQRFQEDDKLLIQSPDEDITKEAAAPSFFELDKMLEKKNQLKPKGSSLRLVCKVRGNPQPQVTWLKNSSPYIQRRSHSTLKLHSVTGKDSGKYTCVARNRLGQTNFTYTVKIIDEISQVPKLIAPYPMNQEAIVGHSVSFQCFIESVVEPEVKWLKRVDYLDKVPEQNATLFKYQGQTFMVLKDAGILQSKGDGSYLNKLLIKNVQAEDAGVFVCLATNRKGFVSRKALLTVKKDSADQDRVSVFPGKSPSQDSSSSESQHSSHSSDDTKLPLLIVLPALAFLIIILIIAFILLRNKRCKQSSSNNKAPRGPVPPAEREAYYYSNCQQQHMQQSVNPLLVTRDKLPKSPMPSDYVSGSEFSSVSRTHYPPHHYHHSHNNHNFGY